MPKGPKSKKKPANSNSCEVHIAKIATGEIEDDRYEMPKRHESGMAGAKARMESTSNERRSQIAKTATDKRWRREMTNLSTREELAATYADKRATGVCDVKFLLDATADDASLEEALEELKRFDEAIAANDGVAFDFGDLRWKD